MEGRPHGLAVGAEPRIIGVLVPGALEHFKGHALLEAMKALEVC